MTGVLPPTPSSKNKIFCPSWRRRNSLYRSAACQPASSTKLSSQRRFIVSSLPQCGQWGASSARRYSSCTCKNSGLASRGGRTLSSARSSCFCPAASSGTASCRYSGASASRRLSKKRRRSVWVIERPPLRYQTAKRPENSVSKAICTKRESELVGRVAGEVGNGAVSILQDYCIGCAGHLGVPRLTRP